MSLSPLLSSLQASGAGGKPQACFQTGAHTQGVCHHCCRRIPRDHARKRAQGTKVFTAFDTPMHLALQYAQGGGAPSYFPVSAITDRFNARNQFIAWRGYGTGGCAAARSSSVTVTVTSMPRTA